MRDRLVGDPDVVDMDDVALITFSTPRELDDYRRRRELPFPILLDPDRTVYDAYGMRRGGRRAVWSPATLRRYWQILRPSGPGSLRDLGAPTEDPHQLGGDVVIAPDGTIAWGHWMSGPADRPGVDELADAIRRART